MKKIAIISDVHGNSFALKEVLKDIKSKKINEIYDLGDSLYGPFDPMGTYKLFIENNIQSLAGNEDRIIIDNLNRKTNNPTLENNKSLMNSKSIAWLKSLPFSYTIGNEIFCCHASPASDTMYLLEEVDKKCSGIRKLDDLSKMLRDIPQSIILCGHSHVNHIVNMNGKTIINPGSVGLPAYDDEHPVFHKMECYNSMTRYCILEFNNKEIYRIEQINLPYDYRAAAELASKNKREDWSKWTLTGRA